MSLRLFAALAIPDSVAAQLLALQDDMPGARWRSRENLHVTLRFYGEVQEPVAAEIDETLQAIARRTDDFELRIKGVGAFGGADPTALIAKVAASPQLEKLAADCERAARRLGLKPETRNFTPHVTLAYLTGYAALADVHSFERQHALLAPAPFRAGRFGLYSSWLRKNAPGIYRLEADYPLGA